MFEQIRKLIEGKRIKELREFAGEINAADLADVMDALSPEERVALFRALPQDLAAEVFSYLPPDTKEELVALLSDPELGRIVDELFLDDAADLVEEMPANVVKRILRQADPEMRQMINDILRYPEDKQSVTGITPEAWHYRWVGLPHSTIMRDEDLCLEEYVAKYGQP